MVFPGPFLSEGAGLSVGFRTDIVQVKVTEKEIKWKGKKGRHVEGQQMSWVLML